MKILVIGASGRVGRVLTQKLLDEGHFVIGTTRESEKIFTSTRYSQTALNLQHSRASIADKFPDNLDAVYFVSGSRGENLLQVDLDGAIKIMKVAEEKKVRRFIMLSAVLSLQPERWEDEGLNPLRDYYLAKHYADLWLINQTTLNYTILQPGALVETKGSGKIEVNVDRHGTNAIENVAEVLCQVLQHPAAFKKVIAIHDGNTPIHQAIAGL